MRSTERMPDKSQPRPGRNEPCHCGSGRKYKQCCLEKDEKAASAARAKAAAAAETPEPQQTRRGSRQTQASAEAGDEPAVARDHQSRLHPARADAAQGRRQLEAIALITRMHRSREASIPQLLALGCATAPAAAPC